MHAQVARQLAHREYAKFLIGFGPRLRRYLCYFHLSRRHLGLFDEETSSLIRDKAATKAKTSCRYLANCDQTESDLNTGLIWEKTGSVGTPNPSDAHDVNNTYN